MSYRFMRLIIFYDLPSVTKKDRRIYHKFHKFLTGSGFVMMQESVYSKLVLNANNAKAIQQSVKEASPKEGLIQMMLITERQYENIEFIIGEKESEVIDSDERLLIL